MATSGLIQSNTEYESYFWVSWSQTSQDVATNKTRIHWSCGVHCGHRFYYNAITMSPVSINGTQVYAGGTYSDFGNGEHEIASGDLDILHNADGTKTFTIGAFTGWLYEHHNYSADAQSFTLTTIPRASSMTVPAFTIGASGTMAITRASSAFTHTIRYAFGSASGTVTTKTSATSVSWTPPDALLNQIPSAVSGTGTLYLDTYSGNTLIGTKSYTFIASAAASVKPSCSIAVTDQTGLKTTYGAYIQGKSKLAITVTGTPNHGSQIKTYKVTADGKTYDKAAFTTEALNGSGTLAIKATVTDARGRTSAEATQTISVLVYAAPVVTISAYRCNSSGTRDEEGAYMKFALSASISSLGSQNSATWRIRYKKSTESSWTTLSGSGTSYTSSVIAADLSALYNVEATVTDRIASTTKAASVPISYVLMDFYNSGRGIAFGQVATHDGFVCAMPISIKGNITFDDDEQTDQRRISFKNSNGTHPHSSSFYGGSPNSTTAIGAYDLIADDRIWAYDDVKKQLVLGDIDGVHVAKMPYTIDRTSDADGSRTKSDLDALLAKMENSAMVNLRLKSNTFIGGSPYYGTLSKYDPSYAVFDGVSYDGERLIWRKYGDTWQEPKVYGESKTINKEQTFTSQTTLFYTGLNVTIPQGYEYKILFRAAYQNSKSLETRLTTSATDTQPYLTIVSGETGYCSVCGYATGEITFYLWARYAAATANKANAYGVMRKVAL